MLRKQGARGFKKEEHRARMTSPGRYRHLSGGVARVPRFEVCYFFGF